MRKKTPSPRKRKSQPVTVIINNMKTKCHKKTYKDIRRLQSTVELCMPKQPFSRLVREIFQNYAGDFKIQSLALQALQEACEYYIVTLMSDANRCCAHAKRVTLQPKDLHLVLDIRGPKDPGAGK